MKNRLYILIGSIAALLITSCKRDHLYFAYSEKANVKIKIDWSATNLESNGVSAYIFDHITGAAVGEVVVNGIPSTINVQLSEGRYDILLINDTEFELDNISFANTHSLDEFVALVNASSEPLYKGLSTKTHYGFSSDCDDMAYSIVENIQIERTDVEYYRDKPNIDELTISKVVETKLDQVTEMTNIEIIVENINSAAGAPRTHLTDIAAGFHFESATKHDKLVTHEFVLNNRVIDPNNHKRGKISKCLVYFGPAMVEDGVYENDHKLIMNFILNNGELYPVVLDVNDLLKTSHDGVQYVHDIKTTITLPEVIGNGGGAFHPDVEEWEDVEVGFPI